MLSAWRYNLTDYINGRIYFDYRQKLGVGEGFGANYDSRLFGRGDFKFYYTQERSRHFEEGQPAEFQRYIVRLRHKWDIDERTDLISQYYKIVDSKMMVAGSNYNILKDYFPREYEKDLQPPFYIEVHHGFNYSTMDLLIQKRPNRWYDPGYLEKLPELKYNLSSIQLGETPLYFEDVCLGGNYNKKNTSTLTPTTNASNPDAHFNRFDTYNKLSFPFKLFFLRLTPYVANRETFYSEGVSGSVSPRTIFYSGADMSTKFYRVFNFKTNAFGLDLNGLRHIITPSIGYAYNHEPTVLSSKLRQIDSIDSITRSNSAALELSNKLQTKRANRNVDIVDFRINSSYTFKPKGGSRSGSYLADIVFNLDIIPYAWLRIEADATYKHSGSREEANYNTFSNANYDVNFNLAAERSFGLGQRYQRKGPNDLTYELKWRVNPKWKFSLYHRRQIGHDYTLKRGLREQEYSIARDLHCWIVELNYNVKREKGETVWVVFRLKAFPEMEFGFNRDYHNPKPGSQSADELGG
jgi:hypothetical protein